jgi:pilus assembly protein CpaB
MQNIRALLISLGVAFIALMMIFSYISKKEKQLLEMATPIKVVVAVKDIPEGTRLDESLIEEKEIPKKYVQPGAIGSVSEALDRPIHVSVLKGTQILEAMFIMAEERGVATKIPTGMRAFSIAVTEVTAVAELIQPGDFVDILATVEVGSFKEGRNVSEEIITKTILENVLVLAVNRVSSKIGFVRLMRVQQKAEGSMSPEIAEPSGQREKTRTLTLALLPEDTQKMNMAQEIGSISASLRSRWDKGEKLHVPPLSSQDFLGVKKNVVPRSPPAWVEIMGAEQIPRY